MDSWVEIYNIANLKLFSEKFTLLKKWCIPKKVKQFPVFIIFMLKISPVLDNSAHLYG